MADARKTLEIVISARDEASRTLEIFGTKIRGMSREAKIGAGVLAGLGAITILAGKSFVTAASFMEQQQVAFRTLIGDVELADQVYQDLVNFAAKTPFQIPQILEQSKRLLAMGTSAEDLVGTFGMLGDVASGVGMEKIPQLVLAFGQIQAKGRLMGTELRQLTEAGFNLAEAMGISNAELDQLITDKAVGFEDVRAAFESVTSEGGKFQGLMGDLALTTAGQLSNMEDNLFKLKAAFGEALLPAVNLVLESLVPLIEKFAEFAEKHPTLIIALTTIALVLGAIGAAALILGPVIAGLAGVIAFLSTIFTGATAVIGIIIAVLGGPLTLIILAVMALVALFALAYKNNWLGIRDKTKAVVEWFKNTALPTIKSFFKLAGDAVKNFTEEWVRRFNIVKDAIMSVVDAIGKLISKAGEIGGSIGGALGFQHGGTVPGGFGEATPAILHGGERVLPRTGTDVNQPDSGGGGATINITVEGDVNSIDTLETIIDSVRSALGRDNELATQGVAI